MWRYSAERYFGTDKPTVLAEQFAAAETAVDACASPRWPRRAQESRSGGRPTWTPGTAPRRTWSTFEGRCPRCRRTAVFIVHLLSGSASSGVRVLSVLSDRVSSQALLSAGAEADLRAAERHVSKALKLDPAHLDAWHALGDLYWRQAPGVLVLLTPTAHQATACLVFLFYTLYVLITMRERSANSSSHRSQFRRKITKLR